ncbi:MAG TPA: efflux RND transporter periplasmic adaptor subunit [Gemmatimonadaceae bacterium]|nr:efflux RND transporter periplasmic adaptor subunit [Gemmatimonadaceae bacterium]
MRPIILVFLAALVAACHGNPSPTAPARPTVTVAPAMSAMITPRREFTGQFAAVQAVEVRPHVSGYIARVEFREGTEVTAGDALFEIDPRPYQAALAGARAQMLHAQSAVHLAQVLTVAAETLYAVHAMAREELDTRASTLAQSMADARAAQAAVDTATLDLEWTVVRAPISGRVSRAAVTAGNYVQTGVTAAPLTTIVSQDPIYVYFNADEQSYLAMGPGERGTVAIGLADETAFPHAARIDFVDNQLDGTTGTIRVRAVVDNRDRRLTPGLFARVQLVTGQPYRATLIEDRAIGTDQDKRYVYVVKADSTIDYRVVEIGPLDNGLRVATSGIAPGDRVVVDGLQRVRPGLKVVAQPEPVAADTRVPR